MYIHVKVQAGAKKETLQKISTDHFEIAVREKAERNLANTRVLELITNYLKISHKKARIVSGHHSPKKIISVYNDGDE